MVDRPILFSAPMVLALLAGRKTQTRRILKPQPRPFECEGRSSWSAVPGIGGRIFISDHALLDAHRWQVGARLWVKETWCRSAETEGKIHYRADGEHVALDDGDGFTAVNKDGSERSPWKSSLFMSRSMSRLTLIVTEVRVERLQDISASDCEAEGIFARSAVGDDPHADLWTWQADGWRYPHPWEAFKSLWTSINGPESWAASPWVVAISFKVERRNIDRLAPSDALDTAGAA